MLQANVPMYNYRCCRSVTSLCDIWAMTISCINYRSCLTAPFLVSYFSIFHFFIAYSQTPTRVRIYSVCRPLIVYDVFTTFSAAVLANVYRLCCRITPRVQVQIGQNCPKAVRLVFGIFAADNFRLFWIIRVTLWKSVNRNMFECTVDNCGCLLRKTFSRKITGCIFELKMSCK